MDYNHIYSNAYSDPYFISTSFDSDITTRHFIILTNQVCWIDLIWINIYSSPNIMNKTGIIIISILHRVSGDTTPTSHMINNLPTSSFIYSFSRSTYRRKIRFRKEFWSLSWVHTAIQILTESSFSQNFQIQDPYFMFQAPQQEEEPTDLDESMKNLIQAANYVT